MATMEIIDVVVLFCIMITLVVAYLQLVAMNAVVEEINDIHVKIENNMNRADSQENVLLDIIQNLNVSLRENTRSVNTMVSVYDQGDDEDDEKTGGLFF